MIRKAVATAILTGVAAAPALAKDMSDWPGCNTKACEKRVWTKHRKRTVRPHRPWLNKVSWCESRHNPRAIGGGGAFRGKYQFTFSSWSAAGGKGDPVFATELEQDYRAVRWAMMIGWGNVHTTAGWPICG